MKKYTYADVCRASTTAELTEASLGRAYQHFKNSGKRSFAILTSWRQPPDGATEQQKNLHNKAQNNAFASLKQMMQSWGYGYFEQMGHGWEERDGKRIKTKEPSLFVIGISLEQAMKCSRKFGQDWFIYSGRETGGKVCGFNPQTGEKVVEWDKFRPMTIAQYFSQIKGKPYTFEALEVKPTWMEGMIGQHIAVKIPNFKRHYLPEKYWSRAVGSASEVDAVVEELLR